jgi:phosphate starvation-inducible protein PhoH
MQKENVDKRKLKTEVKLAVNLTAEQKEVVRKFHETDINFVLGDFGSGKTLTACHIAITEFRKKNYNKIWIARPMLKNSLGALPGTTDEKLFPYIYPILQNLEECQGKEITQKMRENGQIEIVPIEIAKGLTMKKSVIIIDEFLDMDFEDFRTIVTRLGKDSKIIFCGSEQQIDRSMKAHTCWHKVKHIEKEFPKAGFTVLKANHRNPLLTELIAFLDSK